MDELKTRLMKENAFLKSMASKPMSVYFDAYRTKAYDGGGEENLTFQVSSHQLSSHYDISNKYLAFKSLNFAYENIVLIPIICVLGLLCQQWRWYGSRNRHLHMPSWRNLYVCLPHRHSRQQESTLVHSSQWRRSCICVRPKP